MVNKIEKPVNKSDMSQLREELDKDGTVLVMTRDTLYVGGENGKVYVLPTTGGSETTPRRIL